MAKLQPVRGTHDLIGDEARAHIVLVDAARAVAGRAPPTEIPSHAVTWHRCPCLASEIIARCEKAYRAAQRTYVYRTRVPHVQDTYMVKYAVFDL